MSNAPRISDEAEAVLMAWARATTDAVREAVLSAGRAASHFDVPDAAMNAYHESRLAVLAFVADLEARANGEAKP